jgi:cellobiose-specific phosphotransferase system component IIB
MSENEFDFRTWIMEQKSSSYETVEDDPDHYRLITDYAEANISFTSLDDEGDIVEFQITETKTGENCFFLHFRDRDELHANELYEEMVQTLVSLREKQKKHILLSCTSAMTTSYFALALQNAADALNENMYFDAVPLTELYEKGFDADVILLAPQIAYEAKKAVSVFKDHPVLCIPAGIFGSYDAGACLAFLKEQMASFCSSKDSLKVKEDGRISDLRRMLIIAFAPSGDISRIKYRVYDHGEIEKTEEVIKHSVTLRDFEDILDTEFCTCKHPDRRVEAVGIALPGVIREGTLELHTGDHINLQVEGNHNCSDLQKYFEDCYHVPFDIHNNVNAAAIGCYGQQEEYQSLVFHSQPVGWMNGGNGIVIDGKLYEGRHFSAGEDKYVSPYYSYSDNPKKLAWNPDGMAEVIGKSLIGVIAYLDPEAIYIRSDLTPDMNMIRKELLKYFSEEHIPELIHVDDFIEYILIGETELTMQNRENMHA